MKRNPFLTGALGIGLWVGLMLLLKYPQSWLTLANVPVLLIFVSSVYSLLLPLMWSLALSAMAVLMFNYQMVPPVHTFHVNLYEHGILLFTMAGVSWLITYLLRRQKQIAAREKELARRTLELMRWSEKLREADVPQALLPELHALVRGLAADCPRIVLGFLEPEWPAGFALNTTQLEGFQGCLKENRPLGAGTGRYENLEDLYLPMRGKFKAHGVCLCLGEGTTLEEARWVGDVQALLDQMGLACERQDSIRRAQIERESAHNQKIRSLFLTSIAHDQRTPLASIMTSATALLEQGDQLSRDQIRHYAALIHSESLQVARLTDNTLTLARLSGEQVQVPMQAEAVEDMVAAVFQRLRKRKPIHLPKLFVEPGLPLLMCNMVLVEQVLDNLIDNAIQHSGAPETVELKVFKGKGDVLFQVADQGRGMSALHALPGDHSRGLGIGLQLCFAVAQIHSGHLEFTSHAGTGTLATFGLPIPLDWKLPA